MEKSVGSVGFDLSLEGGNAFKNAISECTRYAENSFKSTAASIAKIAAGLFAVDKIIDFTDMAITSASDMQSAWTGLNSIVQGTGNSFSTAQKFITEYTKDGLVSVEEAVKSYKNLLSRGYNTKQIENTMVALKDSAAFGRQANYGLGEAVASATEGLKNENSVLVDNAGVTKNVAKMWEEWAKAHNTTTSAMTQAQKIEAEYNGILRETKFQTGDAAAYSQTFAGQMQIVKASADRLKVAFGKVATPIAQLFLPAINAGITALTNFFNACQQVLSVFGLKFPDVVSKSSNVISGVSLSASDASSNISSTGDAAVKAAKKINKAFGNVDEINVLNTKDNSGSNGGSSAGGGVSPITTAFDASSGDTVTSAVSGIAETILKFIEPLKNISFDNLSKSFGNLIDAIKPINEKIWNGLKWGYENILVPLAKWTIEDLLPAFLDLLAGALKVLNPILETFGNIFRPVWKKLLKPLLSWTGGAVVKIINGVATALGKIGDWMSKNQKVVDAVVGSLTVFFGLWKVTQLMAFIQMSGGLTTAFGTLATSIWACISAKVEDAAQTVILTGMYAVDFVKSIVSGTAALAKQLGTWALSTGAKIADTTATLAATAATTALNAAIAILTSPITLVIAAIAALVGAVVLLIKNWDDLKWGAEQCWNGIKSAFSAAWKWFDNTVIKPIVNVFTGAWNTLKNGAKGAWNGIKSIFSGVASFFGNIFGTAWQKVKDIFSTGGKIFMGIVDGIASAFKNIVNAIIKGINKVISFPFQKINDVLNWIKEIDIPLIGQPFYGFWKYNPIPIPSIPELATGGYVEARNPQLAIIGDNTREGEIVSPESKIYEQVIKAFKDSEQNSNNNFEITLKVLYEDGKSIIKKINKEQIDAGEVLLIS